MESQGVIVQNEDSFIQRKRWYINLIACLHFFRSFVVFLASVIAVMTLPSSVELSPTFVVSIIELLFGILILMKKKYALILYLPILFIQCLFILLMWNWVAYDTWQLILFGSSPFEGILCIYLGISWVRSEWVRSP